MTHPDIAVRRSRCRSARLHHPQPKLVLWILVGLLAVLVGPMCPPAQAWSGVVYSDHRDIVLSAVEVEAAAAGPITDSYAACNSVSPHLEGTPMWMVDIPVCEDWVKQCSTAARPFGGGAIVRFLMYEKQCLAVSPT